MTLQLIGIDLAKNVFHLHGVDGNGLNRLAQLVLPLVRGYFCSSPTHGCLIKSYILVSHLREKVTPYQRESKG